MHIPKMFQILLNSISLHLVKSVRSSVSSELTTSTKKSTANESGTSSKQKLVVDLQEKVSEVTYILF